MQTPGSAKREIRNNQFGGSLGGPIVHNKTFYFSAFEAQKLTAANTLADTAPSPAWVASATQLLNQFGVAVNPVSNKLLALWPADSRTGPASALNFTSFDPNTYSSYNGIVKVDHQLNSMHNISARYFGGGGDQVATTGSPHRAYFQAVPSRMHNVSLVTTSVIHRARGQSAGVRLQLLPAEIQLIRHLGRSVRDGAEHRRVERSGAGRSAEHLDQRLRAPSAARSRSAASTRRFTSRTTCRTRPARTSSRSAARRACRSCSSSTTATSAGRSPSTAPPARGRARRRRPASSLKALADYMAGIPATAIIVRGNTHHNYFQNSFDLWLQDAWVLTSKVTLNFGARYTYPGALGASDAKLTNFLPDKGMVSTDALYPVDKKDVSPRVGRHLRAVGAAARR